MHLVILHHHLNRGGVTSVIENHLRSLATLPKAERPSRVTIVYGGRHAAWNAQLADELPFECSLVVVPEIEYDNFRTNSRNLLDALQAFLRSQERESTVLHFHNHSLGKNGQLASAIGRIADEGWRMVLQVHDFSEDLRPANYQHQIQQAGTIKQVQRELYPQAEQIRYTVLNHRDLQVLQAAGIVHDRLHLLPNPVPIQNCLPSRKQQATWKLQLAHDLELPTSHSFVLYPVRPIRRKNIGELLLWSLLAKNATFALTLAPLNPLEQRAYQHWVELARTLELPVRFEIARQTDLEFPEVYAVADAIITTSVAEGFGLVYLEAALAQKPLVGRNLPSVCQDFESAGMTFPGLSPEMEIPSDQVDLADVQHTHQQHLTRLQEAYGFPAKAAARASSEHSPFSGASIDFARLDLAQQSKLLKRVKTEAPLREILRELNPHVTRIGVADDLQATCARNCQVIAENFSPPIIGKKLADLYRSLLTCKPTEVIRQPDIARLVLGSFVHPNQLFPIRLEP